MTGSIKPNKKIENKFGQCKILQSLFTFVRGFIKTVEVCKHGDKQLRVEDIRLYLHCVVITANHREEVSSKTQDAVEGLCLGVPPEVPGGGHWGQESLGIPTEVAVPTTRLWISGKRKEGASAGIRSDGVCLSRSGTWKAPFTRTVL